MYFIDVNPQRRDDFDYLIVDGRLPAFKQKATRLDTNVVSGHFDYNWRYAEAFNIPGNAAIRANGRQFGRPNKNLKIDAKLIDSYLGRYQLDAGPILELSRKDAKLVAIVNGSESGLVPESETTFYAPLFDARIFFVKDAAGKVTGFTGFSAGRIGDFEGKKLD
jgi:hypothetical protein